MFEFRESPPPIAPHAAHEGQAFLQHLTGRSAIVREAPAMEPADTQPLDLDQRVRNVGEW